MEGRTITINLTPAPLAGLMPPAATPVPAGLPAARTGHGVAGWLAGVPTRVAARESSSDALTAGRPGSREASLVDQLVKGTVGHDDESLPDYRGDGGRR